LYNRTFERAVRVAKEFPFIDTIGSMEDMFKSAEGDIFVNVTKLGSPKLIDFEFPESFVNRYDYIADVTFVPLKPKLIQTAEKLGKANSPGYRMFLYQGKYTLVEGLGVPVDEETLLNKMLEDFKINWS